MPGRVPGPAPAPLHEAPPGERPCAARASHSHPCRLHGPQRRALLLAPAQPRQPRGTGEQSSPGTAQQGRSTTAEPGRAQAEAGEPARHPLPQRDGARAAPAPRSLAAPRVSHRTTEHPQLEGPPGPSCPAGLLPGTGTRCGPGGRAPQPCAGSAFTTSHLSRCQGTAGNEQALTVLSRDMDQWLARDWDLAEGCHVRLFLCRQGQASPADVLWAPPSEEDGCTGLRASASTRCSKPTGTPWCLHPTVWLQQITHRCSDSHLALSFLQHHFFFFFSKQPLSTPCLSPQHRAAAVRGEQRSARRPELGARCSHMKAFAKPGELGPDPTHWGRVAAPQSTAPAGRHPARGHAAWLCPAQRDRKPKGLAYLCYPARAAYTASDDEVSALGTVWAGGNQTAQVLLKLGSRRDQGEKPKPPGKC